MENQELTVEQLDSVAGGVGNIDSHTKTKGPVARCRVCGQPMEYLNQARIDAANTGLYKCTNTAYKGGNCPEYDKTKTNNEVDF